MRSILLFLFVFFLHLLQVDAQTNTDYYKLYELTSGVRLMAHIEKFDKDTIFLTTPEGYKLQLLGEHIVHGIFDTPSQGVWRPNLDERRDWSIRLLIEGNFSQAEYFSEEIRGGGQLKLSAMGRLNDHLLVGPFVGIAAMRAGYHENLAPVGVSSTYEFNNRIGFTTDLGYGIPIIAGPNVTDAGGGVHVHPRLTVKGSHPYNQFNIEFGIGYLWQNATYTRYETGRFIGETILNPGLPGFIDLNIPYRRLSVSVALTFW